MTEHPFRKNILGTPLRIQPPRPPVKRVRFAEYTYTHEGYDFYSMQWVNPGWWPTIRPSQFRAGDLMPLVAKKDG